MARLAAYYQEDFHYAPVGYGPKQRKSAYMVYEEPERRDSFNDNDYVNGGSRLRALASSEPSLSPAYTYSPKTAVMTLKAKPHPFDTKIVEQSRMAIQRLEKMYESSEHLNPYAVSQIEPDSFDCESVYSHGGRSVHDETYVKHKSKSRDKVCKRLSYDSCDSYQQPPEVYVIRSPERYHALNPVQIRSVDTIHGESHPLEHPFINNCEECIMPPVAFRSDSSHGRWQQWPWNMVDTRASPALLSPPSPLDSGLSSQSITSSPSLDAEPFPVHPGTIQVIRPDSHHMCSCPRVYAEPNQFVRYDSGRSSPGAYSVTKNRKSSRAKNGRGMNNGIIYVENDLEDEFSRGQVRYGMLGLVGEPVPQSPTLPKVPNGKYFSPECIQNNNIPSSYYYIEDNGIPYQKLGHRSSKSRKSTTHPTKPSVVITEASDKSHSSSSPEQDISDKSLEPESSMSTEASVSKSSSASSDDLFKKERRRSRRKTEKEICELEDMYKKCNLSDNDLLERAERRDLPTAHQTKSDQSPPALTRSKSDTFYEMLGPTYHNPYETRQRAPPLRRSGIPDIVTDDMALRKHRKPTNTTSAFNPADSAMTYMLCSSHFTPTVSSAGRDILLFNNPDVEYDDLSYRQHYYGKKSKILDPQPPFGIPLRPPPPQAVYNDYLHAVPVGGPKPLCHPRGNPDVVRDDMAFRTLRKDEPERVYLDPSDVYKKKRG